MQLFYTCHLPVGHVVARMRIVNFTIRHTYTPVQFDLEQPKLAS